MQPASYAAGARVQAQQHQWLHSGLQQREQRQLHVDEARCDQVTKNGWGGVDDFGGFVWRNRLEESIGGCF